MKKGIQTLLTQFRDQRVLVIGEAMLDVYLTGTSNRICQEAPVPIVAVQDRNNIPGGAANAAMNVKSLGGNAQFVSVIGDDYEGQLLLKSLQEHGISTGHIFVEKNRQTLSKQRVVSSNHLLVRFDKGTTEAIHEKTEEQLIDMLIPLFEKSDVVIISDYGYGVLTENIIKTLILLNRKSPKIVVIDAKNLERFKELFPTAIKPNYEQAVKMLGITSLPNRHERVQQISAYGEEIRLKTNAEIAAVTMDVDGALVFQKDQQAYRTYTKPADQTNAAGAGDTYIAALSLALASQFAVPTAAEIAATAASIVAQREGTTLCTLSELERSLVSNEKYFADTHMLSLELQRLKKVGKQIVFTNGCFDILHSGHVSYLSKAKALGDILIVALNTDEGVTRLKGPTRPVNSLEDRASVLAALSSVDYIVPFSEDTPIELIKKVRPDVYVKGGDYARETLPETPYVEMYGGIVQIMPYISDYSTTGMINKIKKSPRKEQIYHGR